MTRHRITTAEYSAIRKEAKENATLEEVVAAGTKASKAARAKGPGLGNEEFLARAKRIEASLNRAAAEVTEALDDEESTYDDLTNAQLSELLEQRDLPHSGTKAELIARLQESDAAQAAENTE